MFSELEQLYVFVHAMDIIILSLSKNIINDKKSTLYIVLLNRSN